MYYSGNELFGEHQLSAEELLFVAILQRAIMDVELMQALPAKPPKDRHQRQHFNTIDRDGRDAANFLFKRGDLDEWADMVGVDVSKIRLHAGRAFPEIRRILCLSSFGNTALQLR